ncbi:MAG: hypothetical protein ACERLM_14095, partial [Acidimicrobiales bacterium]
VVLVLKLLQSLLGQLSALAPPLVLRLPRLVDPPVVGEFSRRLGRNGCLNFFAGPTDPGFSAACNFYNVHYASTHIMGTSGGNTADMVEALDLMEYAGGAVGKRVLPVVVVGVLALLLWLIVRGRRPAP